MTTILVDTGALVALLDRADLHHEWALDCFKRLRPPLMTCEAVLAEALHLLSDLPPSADGLARLHKERILQVDFDFSAHAETIWRMIRKYRELPMDFADACLVRMPELRGDCRIWTTDSNFGVYRRHGRQALPRLSP